MSHNSAFRFFDLPRELRDVIYDLLILPTKTISEGIDENDTTCVATNVPTPALLRISKQLHAEYSDLVPKFRTLHILGGHCTYWSGYPDINGLLAHSVDRCLVYIHVECYCDNMSDGEREEHQYDELGIECDAVDFLHNYRDALQPFLSQFPYLESAHLRVGLWGSEQLDDECRKGSSGIGDLVNHTQGFWEALSMLVALPLEIVDLQVSRCVSDEQYDEYRLGKVQDLPTYVTWTRSGGWQNGDIISGRNHRQGNRTTRLNSTRPSAFRTRML